MTPTMPDLSGYSLKENHPYPTLFMTVSGSHLYGFESADSDVDLRGVHLLPLEDLLGLGKAHETVEQTLPRTNPIDLVTHDLGKFCRLLLKRNGYALEQIFSPLVVADSYHCLAELRELASGCVTRYHWHHYRGFAEHEYKLFQRHPERRVKRALYLVRVLLAGIHLMRTGTVEAHLPTLLDAWPVARVNELLERKRLGYEGIGMDDAEAGYWTGTYVMLQETLKRTGELSDLPERQTAQPALNAFLLQMRRRSAWSRGDGN